MVIFIILTCLGYAVISDPECKDIAPGGSDSLSCVQQGQWGKCSRKWLYKWGYCRQTCGQCTPPQNMYLECTDVPPDSYYTCPQQKKFGKCNASWMLSHNCRLSCGKCAQSEQCIDVPPDNLYTCAQQKQFGQCNSKWLIERNFCRRTCGKCPPELNQESNQLPIEEFPQLYTVLEYMLVSSDDQPTPKPLSFPGIITPSTSVSAPLTLAPAPLKEKCSIMNALQNNSQLTAQNPSAYEAFQSALDSNEESLKKYLNQKGLEGVVLVPSERTWNMYLSVLSKDQLVQLIQYYVIPYDLNQFTIGPYEYSLQGSSVQLIRDEFVENEVATSAATVVEIVSLLDDPNCQQDLEFWTIEGLLVPPLFEKPVPISPSLVTSYYPEDAFRASSSSAEQLSSNGESTPGFQFLMADNSYQYDPFSILVEDITPQQSVNLSTSQTPQQQQEQQSILNSLLATDYSYDQYYNNYYQNSTPQQGQFGFSGLFNQPESNSVFTQLPSQASAIAIEDSSQQ